ncbi:hypothetical protein Tco_0526852 [Tanacetum coccineum]
MNKALALIAKAFKINTIPTNNNQRSSLIPRNNQIAQPDLNTSQDIKMQMVDDNVGNQNVENMNGLGVDSEIANQYGNGNVATAPAEGNGNGINVKPRKRDAAYLQQQLQFAQEEEVGIQSTQEEFKFMAAADAYKETERVKVNCTSEDTLQQASKSGTQSDNASIYDSDGSTEVPKDENCYDHDTFNMLTHEVQYTDIQTELDRMKEKLENCIIKKEKEYAVLWNNWYTKCEECKYDKISYDKAYNDMQQKIERLQAQLGYLKGKSSDTQCASNTLDPVSHKLKDENVSLEFQNFRMNPSKTLGVNNTAKPRRQIPGAILILLIVTANHDVCVLNYVNDMNSHADNQTANASIRENQKKHKANTKKSKELGSTRSLASSRPSKPRTCLRWIPTGRIFAICGKLTASSNTENKSEKSVCDNASTSKPSEPSSKGFSISTSLLGSHDVNDRVRKSIRSSVQRIIQIEKIKLFQSLPLFLLLMHPINVINNKIQLHLLQL